MKTTDQVEEFFSIWEVPNWGEKEYYKMLPLKTGFVAGFRAAEKDSAERIGELEAMYKDACIEVQSLRAWLTPLKSERDEARVALNETVEKLMEEHISNVLIVYSHTENPIDNHRETFADCKICALITKYRKEGGV